LIAWGGAVTLKLVAARAAAIVGIIILPTAIGLGRLVPFLGSLAAQAERNATYYLTNLYCINLFGAALYALTAPFLIFPNVGRSEALVVCLVVDGPVALYAGWLVRGAGDTAPTTEESSEFRCGASDAVILGVAFISGLLFRALEVIWAHLVGVVIGTRVYVFSSMLFVVLSTRRLVRSRSDAQAGAAPRPFVRAVLSLREHSAGAGRALAIGSGWNRAFGAVCHRLLFRRNGPSRHLHWAS
jgi:hypothetical protein